MRRLYCLCPASWKEAVLPRLSEEAGPDWQRKGLIDVKWLSEGALNNYQENEAWVQSRLAENVACEFIMLGSVLYYGSTTPSFTSTVRFLKDPKEFRSKIGTILRANGADIVRVSAERIGPKWATFEITPTHISNWLDQFEDLGGYGWIGKGVLAALQCFSTAELTHLLDLGDLGQADRVTYYLKKDNGRTDWGEDIGSSTPLAHAVSKSGINTERFDLQIARNSMHRYILIDDCAISGSECEDFLNETILSNHASECDRLISLNLRYGVLANGAERRIRRFLTEHHLENSVLNDGSAVRLRTLTKAGIDALDRGEFYDAVGKHCRNPNAFIELELFSRTELWGDSQRAESAKKLLRRVGERLYEADLIKRKGTTHTRSSEWLRQAGLGAGGLGLTLALERSVPKSTLPVVWASGEILWGTRRIKWTPLLPHGEVHKIST